MKNGKIIQIHYILVEICPITLKQQSDLNGEIHIRRKNISLDECLNLYEKYIRGSDLYNSLDELKGKELGCWCKPNRCHGDILIKLLNEKSDF